MSSTAVVVLVFACTLCTVVTFAFGARADKEWVDFKAQFGKSYQRQREESFRRLVWEDNMEFIERHNAKVVSGNFSYTLGANEFADWTHVEFVKTFNGLNLLFNKSELLKEVENSKQDSLWQYPSQVDWRKEGYVTPVKNQKRCGSCWAFSATGALEGQHFRATGRLVSLSEQNLVDCTRNYGNKGCGGGFPYKAMQYIADNGGINTEASYPYEGKDGTCRYRPGDVGATDKGYEKITRGSESDLQRVVAGTGPVSVCIDAAARSFMFYRQGVYDNPSCSSWHLDHAVLAVGYGSTSYQNYWIVKNSWGPTWGESGYVRMSRNKGNQCGIATMAVYPVV